MSLCCSLLCMIPICFTSTPPPILGDRKFLTFLKNTFFHYDSMPMHPLLPSHLKQCCMEGLNQLATNRLNIVLSTTSDV